MPVRRERGGETSLETPRLHLRNLCARRSKHGEPAGRKRVKKEIMKKRSLQIIAIVALCVVTVAVVFLGVTTVRFLWFRPLVVSGGSMSPTLKDGQLIYVNTTRKPQVGDVACFFLVTEQLREDEKLPSAEYYGGNGFARSMPIWGLKIPEKYSGGYSILVKRVVALGGDTVELRAEQVEGANLVRLYRNGTAAEEDLLMLNKNELDDATTAYAQAYAEAHGIEKVYTVYPVSATKVAEGRVYVLGDNRGSSTDSRFFGAIDAGLFVGVVRGQ